MVSYTCEEDSFLVKTHNEYLKNGNRPRWTEIQEIFNDKIAEKTGKKYTVSMLRNRFQRMEKGQKILMQSKKRKRNRCGRCGKYVIGHSCEAKIPEKINTDDTLGHNTEKTEVREETTKKDELIISDEDICSTIEAYENMRDVNSFTLPPYLSIAFEVRPFVSSPTFGFLY